MLNALKIWWLERQHKRLAEDLAVARKYQWQEHLFMEITIGKLEKEKQKIFLRLLSLKKAAEQPVCDAEHA